MPSAFQQIWLVARRDWSDAASSKVFWIASLLGPVLIVVFAVVSGMLVNISVTSSGTVSYGVLDRSGGLAEDIAAEIKTDALIDFFEELDLEDLTEEENIVRWVVNEIETVGLDSVITSLVTINDSEVKQQKLQDFITWWQDNTQRIIELAPSVSMSKYIHINIDEDDEISNTPKQSMFNRLIEDESILGYFVIPEDVVNSYQGAQFVTSEILDTSDISDWYGSYANTVVQQKRSEIANIDAETAAWITQRVYFNPSKPIDGTDPDSAGSEEFSLLETAGRFIPAIYQYVLWFMVLIGSTMLMTNTIEEKSSKLVEVLLSDMDANLLMDGKLLGSALILLTVIGCWLTLPTLLFGFGGGSLLLFNPTMAEIVNMELLGTIFKPIYLVNFVIFLVMGFAFYGYLLSAVGAVCENVRDAQVLSTPITLFLVVPMLLIVPLALNPDGLLAIICAVIPPFTPFVMMTISAELPALPWYLLIVAWMAVATYGTRWVAGRIYSRGILLEQKPKGLKGLLSLVRDDNSNQTQASSSTNI